VLYLCPCLTAIDNENKPPLTDSCAWRWLSQASFSTDPLGENLFELSDGSPAWVFQTDKEISGFEIAPDVYPNGVPILDDGCIESWQEFIA
jgi:hypothetical protein